MSVHVNVHTHIYVVEVLNFSPTLLELMALFPIVQYNSLQIH